LIARSARLISRFLPTIMLVALLSAPSMALPSIVRAEDSLTSFAKAMHAPTATIPCATNLNHAKMSARNAYTSQHQLEPARISRTMQIYAFRSQYLHLVQCSNRSYLAPHVARGDATQIAEGSRRAAAQRQIPSRLPHSSPRRFRAFSPAVQARRRPAPVNTSIRRAGSGLEGVMYFLLAWA
jgi:hypothetical protein